MQTRYNLPIEILYTVAPVMMVLVFFFFTVDRPEQRAGRGSDTTAHADHTVTWSGSSGPGRSTTTRTRHSTGRRRVYDGGTTADRPTLFLPVDESVDFELRSPDVIHSFWVPAFLFKMDVVPGRRQPLRVHADPRGHVRAAGAPSCAASTTRGCCST